jgi:hypothetical protein
LLLIAFRSPTNLEYAAKETGMPMFRVRSGVRELVEAGLIRALGVAFEMTEAGMKKLEEGR